MQSFINHRRNPTDFICRMGLSLVSNSNHKCPVTVAVRTAWYLSDTRMGSNSKQLAKKIDSIGVQPIGEYQCILLTQYMNACRNAESMLKSEFWRNRSSEVKSKNVKLFLFLSNWLSTMPWRRMGKWMYNSMFSWPRNYLEVSVQLHALAALSPRKEPSVPSG
jgi:hypothetical protein